MSAVIGWAPLPHVAVGGVRTAVASRAELAAAFIADSRAAQEAGGSHRSRLVFDVNGQGLSLAHRDEAFRSALAAADVVHADGAPIVAAARRFAARPIAERSATTDLYHDLCRAAAEAGQSIYLLGGEERVNAECARRTAALYPGLHIAGRRNGFFSGAEEEAVVDEIAAAAPDLLFVGIGKPREQQFAARHAERLGAIWTVTCGGCFNFVTGDYRRAPQWMQDRGLEWLHRLATRPRQLGWRYLTTSPHAFWLLWRHRDRTLYDSARMAA